MTAFYPLTTFEEYMLHDDSVEHPMTFFLRTDFQGAVQVAQLQSSFDEVVRRHPIFWSIISNSGRTGFAWKPDPTRIPSLQVRTSDTLGECPLQGHLNLETQPGIRACLNVGAASTELWLQLHHACCDGMAGIAFLNELIEAYQRHTSQAGPPLVRDFGVFPEYSCAYSSLTRWEKTKRLWRDVKCIATFCWRRLLSPWTSHRKSTTTAASPAYVEARIPFTSSIRTRLKRSHPWPATVNDILLRDIYLALADLIRTQRLASDRGWIRLVVPMSLRKHGAPSQGCRNNMCLAFVDRQVAHLKRKAELLRSICHEMAEIKQQRKGYAMLRALHWLRCTPSGLAWIATVQRGLATVIVSNLGEVPAQLTKHDRLVADDASITGLGFLVPIRAGTPIAFGVLTYADELTLSMQYDARLIDRESANALLSNVVHYLDNSLGKEHSESAWTTQRRAA